MNKNFKLFPAIDLRQGKVVRLKEGDPNRQTHYSSNPAEMAQKWLEAGSSWLHVVNLDGAFGENSQANLSALKDIVTVAQKAGAQVQFGGGMRDLASIETAFSIGVSRIVIGTMAIEQTELFKQVLNQWGPERVAVSLDARNGMVQLRGWQTASVEKAVDVAIQLKQSGLSWLVFTDIARDGLQTGINLDATREIARSSQLNVIASGGVSSEADVWAAEEAGLAGIIIGRALYEGQINLQQLIETLTGGA